jgi:acetyl esterase
VGQEVVAVAEVDDEAGGQGVDPDSQAVLDQIAAAGRPPLHEAGVAAARAAVQASRQAFAAEPVATHVRDIAAPGPGGAVPIRLYRPLGPTADARLPLLVFFHGGGWVLGDINSGDAFCASVAQQAGIVVAAVDYRLAPEHVFPAGIEDAFAALNWLAGGKADPGIDPDRVAVAGDSAGGTLATVCALLARDAGAPALRAQVLLYPVTDLAMGSDSYRRNASGYLLTAETMRWFRDLYLAGADVRDWRASPLYAADLGAVAPALVVTCGFDPLCDEGAAYAARLTAAGVSTRELHLPRQVHGFAMWGKLVRDAEIVHEAVVAQLRHRFA